MAETGEIGLGVASDGTVRARICTASEEMAERLLKMLRRWACSECVALSAERAESALPESEDVQLLFLDMDSPDVPENLPIRKRAAGLIVISGDAGQAIRSYRWHPATFLKPDFDTQKLRAAMTACEKFWLPGRLGLESPYRRRSFRLPLGRIRYVEAEAHYCRFSQGRTNIRLRFSIDELAGLLPDPPFVRCHRSYLVHLGAVTGMTYTGVTLREGVSLPVGRTYAKSLREALRAWQRGENENDGFGAGL